VGEQGHELSEKKYYGGASKKEGKKKVKARVLQKLHHGWTGGGGEKGLHFYELRQETGNTGLGFEWDAAAKEKINVLFQKNRADLQKEKGQKHRPLKLKAPKKKRTKAKRERVRPPSGGVLEGKKSQEKKGETAAAHPPKEGKKPQSLPSAE